MGRGKLKNWTGNLGLILGGIACGVFVGEIGLRVADIPSQLQLAVKTVNPPNAVTGTNEPPATPSGSFYRIDPNLGWGHKPGMSGWWREEGNAYVEINRDGFRDRDYPQDPPPNTIRIAVLGDSFAEAMQVDADEALWAVMERKLADCPVLKERRIEAINFGVTNYGTAQQLLMLRQKVWNYSPDIVLLAVFTGNDISDNYRKLDNRNRPYFIYKKGELIPDMSFRNPDRTLPPYGFSRVDVLPDWLVKKSRIIQRIKKVELENRNRRLEERRKIIYNQVFIEPQTEVWKEAWKVTEKLILLMRDEVMKKNADFLVVTLSNEVQVNPDPNFRKDFAEERGISDLFYPDKRLKRLGDRHDFTVLNLAPIFQSYAEKKQVCLHGFENAVECGGHWNQKGHGLAGELIAPTVCQLLENRESAAAERGKAIAFYR